MVVSCLISTEWPQYSKCKAVGGFRGSLVYNIKTCTKPVIASNSLYEVSLLCPLVTPQT